MQVRTDDRHDTVLTFRNRLERAMDRVEISQSELARQAGIDRSTLSQLLKGEGQRLPRAETVAAIARCLQISMDWLLGLSGDERTQAAILRESIEIAPLTKTPVDENLARWHDEAVGTKIRYVPSTLPDLMKTEATLNHEFRDYAVKSPKQAITASRDKRRFSRLPDADMEICLPRQRLENYAAGTGLWQGISKEHRLEQLEEMQSLLQELYPKLRLFLFDGLTHYAAPYTIFGRQRAAIYMGQMYFAFTTRDHVRTLTDHFDDLIRAAVIQSNEVSDFVGALKAKVAD